MATTMTLNGQSGQLLFRELKTVKEVFRDIRNFLANRANTSLTPVRTKADRVGTVGVRYLAR
jgi:hypothetical protein